MADIVLTLDPPVYGQAVALRGPPENDIAIRVPESCEIEVAILDDGTSEPLPRGDLRWELQRPTPSGPYGLQKEFGIGSGRWNSRKRLYEVRVPPGKIEFSMDRTMNYHATHPKVAVKQSGQRFEFRRVRRGDQLPPTRDR
jgi:hypothetical protein